MRKLRLIKPWHLPTLRQKTFNDRMFFYETAIGDHPSGTGPSQEGWSAAHRWSPLHNHLFGAPDSRVAYKAPIYPR